MLKGSTGNDNSQPGKKCALFWAVVGIVCPVLIISLAVTTVICVCFIRKQVVLFGRSWHVFGATALQSDSSTVPEGNGEPEHLLEEEEETGADVPLLHREVAREREYRQNLSSEGQLSRKSWMYRLFGKRRSTASLETSCAPGIANLDGSSEEEVCAYERQSLGLLSTQMASTVDTEDNSASGNSASGLKHEDARLPPVVSPASISAAPHMLLMQPPATIAVTEEVPFSRSSSCPPLPPLHPQSYQSQCIRHSNLPIMFQIQLQQQFAIQQQVYMEPVPTIPDDERHSGRRRPRKERSRYLEPCQPVLATPPLAEPVAAASMLPHNEEVAGAPGRLNDPGRDVLAESDVLDDGLKHRCPMFGRDASFHALRRDACEDALGNRCRAEVTEAALDSPVVLVNTNASSLSSPGSLLDVTRGMLYSAAA